MNIDLDFYVRVRACVKRVTGKQPLKWQLFVNSEKFISCGAASRLTRTFSNLYLFVFSFRTVER